MSSDDNGLDPPRNWLWDLLQDYRLTKDGSSKNIPNLTETCHRAHLISRSQSGYRAIRAFPHMFQLEFLDPRLIRRDCRTLDADAVFYDSIRGVGRDLVICLWGRKLGT